MHIEQAMLKTPAAALLPADKKLLHACAEKDVAGMKQALAEGASVEAFSDDPHDRYPYKHPAHIAAKLGFDEGLRLLLAAGADIDAGEEDMQNTPLMLAIDSERLSTFRLLLHMGADLRKENVEGTCAADLCDVFGCSLHGEQFSDIAHYHDHLPMREDLEGLSAKKLFRKNLRGHCLMDNPLMLRRMGEIVAALAQEDEFLTLEQLTAPGAEGTSALEKLCVCGKLAETVKHLNAHGEILRGELLLNGDGMPTELLRLIIEHRQLPALFTEANWKDARKQDLDTLLGALPSGARAEIGGVHRLRLHVEREQGHQFAWERD